MKGLVLRLFSSQFIILNSCTAQSTAPALNWHLSVQLILYFLILYLDNDTAAAHDLTGFALAVDLA